jgi:hypothetical protein
MSIAKIAYLTSPGEGRYVANFQVFGSDDLMSIEIGPDQMRNILIDGITLMLRQSFHRVPIIKPEETANGPAGINAQRTA